MRRRTPRFLEGNLEANLSLVEALRDVAGSKGVSVAQIAIAWVLAQGADIVPVVGARRRDQPNRSAPSFKQRTSWRWENGRSGFSGSTCVSFFARKSIGSMPSRSAISSIATSSAIRPGASPGARIALPSGRSSTARCMEMRRLAPA